MSDLQDDARHAAREMLQPYGRKLTELMEGIIREAATAMTYTRGKLRERASSAKGLSGRTLVEWHKAESMAMARAKAIATMTDQGSKATSYEQMLADLTAGDYPALPRSGEPLSKCAN